MTRIKLKLSEYNFSIKPTKGKDNVGADVLSGISIDELKNHTSTESILAVTTRTMSKQNDINKEPLECVGKLKLQICDKFSQDFNNKVSSKIKSEIYYVNEKINAITLKVYNKFILKFLINDDIVNETLNIDFEATGKSQL